jgi:hypothetical protein
MSSAGMAFRSKFKIPGQNPILRLTGPLAVKFAISCPLWYTKNAGLVLGYYTLRNWFQLQKRWMTPD